MFSITWLKDTSERVVVTFLEAWIGAWVVIENVEIGQLFGGDVLTVGLVGAGLSLLKALGATRFGSKDSASLIE